MLKKCTNTLVLMVYGAKWRATGHTKLPAHGCFYFAIAIPMETDVGMFLFSNKHAMKTDTRKLLFICNQLIKNGCERKGKK